MEHLSRGRLRQSGSCRDSEFENLELGGGYNVWIRADRDPSDYLFDRVDHQKSVRAGSHSTTKLIEAQLDTFH